MPRLVRGSHLADVDDSRDAKAGGHCLGLSARAQEMLDELREGRGRPAVVRGRPDETQRGARVVIERASRLGATDVACEEHWANEESSGLGRRVGIAHGY